METHGQAHIARLDLCTASDSLSNLTNGDLLLVHLLPDVHAFLHLHQRLLRPIHVQRNHPLLYVDESIAAHRHSRVLSSRPHSISCAMVDLVSHSLHALHLRHYPCDALLLALLDLSHSLQS